MYHSKILKLKDMKLNKYIMTLAGAAMIASCSNFLDETAQGIISSEQLNTAETVDQMCNAAYSTLGNVIWSKPTASLWYVGSVRSGDAYKGGGGAADCGQIHQYEMYTTNTVDNSYTNNLWVEYYNKISRVNEALHRLNGLTTADMPLRDQRIGEMKFLRGHYYFDLKILYKFVPFIDENVTGDDYNSISNRDLTNQELWDKIAQDFRDAANALPASQVDKGRPNKYAAKAYLAKTLLYQAYIQGDDSNAVTGIDKAKLEEVNNLCQEVISSGDYDLFADYGDNFLEATENGVESIFAIQFSQNDGTKYGRVDMDHALNYPMSPSYGCCGFHMASANLINAFKTQNGLPYAEYNKENVAESMAFDTNTFDPRLDHTVGIPGHPYKYENTHVYDKSWSRDPGNYGYFSSMKEMQSPNDGSFVRVSPYVASSKNIDLLRYDDVILFKAEALIELEREKEALPLINQIRERAAKSDSRLIKDGKTYSNYNVAKYVDGVNCNWTQDFAREALRFERRLEFAMEGNRFFDLVRWGIAAEYLNNYLAVEKDRAKYLKDAKFTKNRDEYLPIPLNQINYSKGLYKQNVGW